MTHTIAYTIWGVMRTAEVVKSAEGKAAAESAAYAALRRLELSKRLPGILDHRWKPLANFTCLTGNVQMALIWLHMYSEHGDPRLLNAALKSIDIVKAAQAMDAADPGVRGGIAGSQPVWGDYISHAFPNWAAKYFIDALLAKDVALANEIPFRTKPVAAAEPVPTTLPAASSAQAKRPRIALLSSQVATKVMEFHNAWSKWGFRPDLVLIERWPVPPLSARVRGSHSRRPPDEQAGIHAKLDGFDKRRIQQRIAASRIGDGVLPAARLRSHRGRFAELAGRREAAAR